MLAHKTFLQSIETTTSTLKILATISYLSIFDLLFTIFTFYIRALLNCGIFLFFELCVFFVLFGCSRLGSFFVWYRIVSYRLQPCASFVWFWCFRCSLQRSAMISFVFVFAVFFCVCFSVVFADFRFYSRKPFSLSFRRYLRGAPRIISVRYTPQSHCHSHHQCTNANHKN